MTVPGVSAAMPSVSAVDHETHDVSAARGFLPDRDPLASFDAEAAAFLRTLDALGDDLPGLLDADELRPRLRSLDPPAPDEFDTLSRRELVRVYSVSGFLASAYVHKVGAEPVDTLPAGVAVPLFESTRRLDRPPILSYDGYALANWQFVDPERGFLPHNLETLTNFVSLYDERWFIVVHVVIEARAAPALGAIGDAQQGVVDRDDERVEQALRTIEDALHDVVSGLDRMPERNDPANYGPSFRPYIMPFTEVTYEGVDALDGPQSFRGETGAQSSLFPALDAALSVDHDENPLVRHVRDMRAYMPPKHRAFIDAVDDGPDVRSYVADRGSDELVAAYNACLDQLVAFRSMHADYAREYILERVGDEEGTGGTPYGPFLDNLIEDTRARKLSS